MVRALVTGAAGFVGSGIVQSLLSQGVEDVIGLDRLSDYYDPSIKRSRVEAIRDPRFSFHVADLNTDDLARRLADVDVIFHQAGQPGVRPSWGDSFGIYIEDNIRATQRLLEAVVASGNRAKVVYASSSSVYGDAQRYPVRESDMPNPRSPYGVTKLAAEHLVSLYAENHGVRAVSLRYFTVYGPGQRPDMAFTRMCRAVAAGEPIEVYGTGEQIRDFTYIDDVVAANLLAWTRETPRGVVINVAGGTSASLNACIQILGDVSGRPVHRTSHPSALGDVYRTGGSTERAADILGWAPTVELEQGLRAQYEWVSGLDARA